MKKFRRLLVSMFSAFSVFGSCLSMAACGGKSNSTVIAVSLNDLDAFRTSWLESFTDKANKEGYSIISRNAASNADKQISDIESLILQNPDALVVHAQNGDAVAASVKKAHDAGKKVVVIDLPVTGEENYDAYICDGQAQFGKIQGQYIKSWLEADNTRVANIGALVGTYGMEILMQRSYAAYAELGIPKKEGVTGIPGRYTGQVSSNGKAKVVAEADVTWSGAKATTTVEAWLSSNPEINVFACHSDEIALGVIQALKAANKNLDDYLVLGVDGSEAGIKALQSGDLDCTAGRSLDIETKCALDTIKSLLAGDKLPNKNIEPNAVVAFTKEDYKK